jgi:TolB-like protein
MRVTHRGFTQLAIFSLFFVFATFFSCTTLQPIKVEGNLSTVIKKAHEELVSEIPENTKLAILDITYHDPVIVDRITDGLTTLTIKMRKTKGLRVIERDDSWFNQVLKEQGIHASYVSNNDAVRIGHILGADMIIVGEIINNNKSRMLRLRVIDVESAEIISSFFSPI